MMSYHCMVHSMACTESLQDKIISVKCTVDHSVSGPTFDGMF